MSDQSYDVVVVGAGPVGLAAARLLSMKDVRVAVVDPNRVVCQHPRATHLNDEAMRLLQTLGLGAWEQEFLRQVGWEMLAPDGKPFLILPMPAEESDQALCPHLQFHQPDFESRLRGALFTDERADLFFGWEVVAADQTDDTATVTIRSRRTGQEQELDAAYVVGADGAGSFMRPMVADEVEDLHGTQRSLIVDVFPFEHPKGLPPNRGFIICEGRNPITYVPIFPPMLRFEFMLQDGDDAEQFERPNTICGRLGRWFAPGSYRIMRSDVYEWHAYLVRGWRRGRFLLAGDAAHEMPPMLGEGMCSGLRDIANLAWKLAEVIAGRSDPSLLDTYESERSPHVRPYIEESARQANLVESFGTAENRPSLGEPQQTAQFRPPLGPGLVDKPSDPVGQLAPQPRTDAGVRVDDLVGYHFAVLGDEALVNAVGDDVRRTWRQLGAAVVTEPSADLRSWLDDHSAAAVIIRPDRYVFALAASGHDLTAATADLRRRLTIGASV